MLEYDVKHVYIYYLKCSVRIMLDFLVKSAIEDVITNFFG